MMNGVKRYNCPLCGSKIIVMNYYMFSHDHDVLKSGRVSKRYTKSNECSQEISIAQCTSCDVHWNADEFEIDNSGYFIDCKYTEKANYEEDNEF